MTDRITTGRRFLNLACFIGEEASQPLPARPCLIVFIRGYWCEHCRHQLVRLAKEAGAFNQHGVSIVAISTDDQNGIASMLDLIDGAFPIVRDGDATLIRELDLVDPFEFRQVPVTLPAVFLVDESGIVRYHYVGRAPDDRPRTELLLLAAEQIARRKC